VSASCFHIPVTTIQKDIYFQYGNIELELQFRTTMKKKSKYDLIGNVGAFWAFKRD
jgi:hypothetical protein